MFKVKQVRNLLFSILLVAAFTTLVTKPVVAASCSDTGCTGCNNPKLDLGCQRERLFSPTSNVARSCKLYFCADGGTTAPTQSSSDIKLNLFGVQVRINTDAGIYALLALGFSMFLGIVAIALVVIGLRAAIRRARAESDDEMAAAAKTMQNSAVGFGIIILSLVIVQIVANLVGVGSIVNLVSFSIIGR
jgi:hypothetical protein